MKVKTSREKYDPAMRIMTQEEADAYLEQLIQLNMGTSEHTREQAYEIERENLGYWAGYGTVETRKRIERLFRCRHPLLPPAEEPQPTLGQLLELARQTRKKHSVAGFRWPRREGPFE